MYTKIEFKLTSARKIEIKLIDSANKNILYHYYYAINGIFVRHPKGWTKADVDWFPAAQRIFSSLLKKCVKMAGKSSNPKIYLELLQKSSKFTSDK